MRGVSTMLCSRGDSDSGIYGGSVVRHVSDSLGLAIGDWVWHLCEREDHGLCGRQRGQAADDKYLGEHLCYGV